jgi:hypothetical protein
MAVPFLMALVRGCRPLQHRVGAAPSRDLIAGVKPDCRKTQCFYQKKHTISVKNRKDYLTVTAE